jgi:pilus assembly protein CpaB
MNVKKAMPLILAVVLGLVAMVMARKLLKPPAPTHTSTSMTPVVVATRDVPPGKELTAEDLTAANVPSSVVPAEAHANVADLVGRVATSPLVKGQAVLETLLAPTGSGVGLGALVPEGMRAMTMNIDEITGLGGMIVPGCHVDVMAIVPDERTKQQMARTVLQDLKIVAVGRQFTASSGDAPPAAPTNNVTFLVTPEQGRLLQLAASTARPWLVLRSGRDKATVAQDRTSIAVMHGDDEVLAATRPSPTTGPSETAVADANTTAQRHGFQNVEVIRGSTVTHVALPMPADLGGSGLPQRTDAATGTIPGNSGAAVAKAPKPEKPEASRPGIEASQSPRPAAIGEVDQSDAFKVNPFDTGSPR